MSFEIYPQTPSAASHPRLDHVLTLPVMGVRVRFESNSREVLDIAEKAFGAWRCLEAHPRWIEPLGVRVRVTVVPGDEGPDEHAPVSYGTPRRDLVLVTTPGSRGSADALARLSELRVTDTLVRDANHFRYSVLEGMTLALVCRFDREPLHAACVVRGDRALLLAGPNEVGKSTLTYAALRSGLKVMSEDMVFLQLEPRLRVWGMPGYVHLLPDALENFPELKGCVPTLRANGTIKVAVGIREMGGTAELPVVERAGICLLQRGEGGPRLEELSPEQVVHALIGKLEPGFDLFADTIGARVQRLAEHGGWRMTLPHYPPDAVPVLHEMFDAL